MIGSSFLTFSLTYIIPGDPAEMMFRSQDAVPSDEVLDKVRMEMGLNDPFLIQYGNWFKNVIRGDLGNSYILTNSVASIMGERIPMTLLLALAALVIVVLASFSLGILSAVRQNKFLDFLIRALAMVGISIPGFWLGLILMYVSIVKLKWFSIMEMSTPKGIFLPALTLAIPLVGRYTRQIRAAVLEQLSQDYVTGAKSRGISGFRIIFFHVLPNSLKSIITLFALSIGVLLGGTVIVETIFSWPGIGAMVMSAIRNRDYPVLQGYVLFMSFVYIIISFMVEVFINFLDPRLRIKGEKSI